MMFYIFPKVFKIPKVYFSRSWVDKFHFFPSMCTSLFIFLREKKQYQQQQKESIIFILLSLIQNVVFKTYCIFVTIGGLSVRELEEFI